MTCISHKQTFQLGYSSGCKRWGEEDSMKILDRISLSTKLVDDQISILFLPVVPKYLSFDSIECAVVVVFSTKQLLRNDNSLDIFQCLPPRSELHFDNVAVSPQLAPNCFGVHDVFLWCSKQFKPSTSACTLNNCIRYCKRLPVQLQDTSKSLVGNGRIFSHHTQNQRNNKFSCKWCLPLLLTSVICASSVHQP